ncbi:MAG: class I SAM-dependent methyltransferase [Sediminibacterium sp.]
MHSNVGIPFFSDFNIDEQLEWQMSRAEKYCFINLLQHIRPNTSIEIGTYKGGSLQVLNHFSKNIYSIDVSKAPEQFLSEKFPNVNFRIGESHITITKVFKEIEEKGLTLDFILVDGDHTTRAVQQDLEAILSYPHKNSITVILHDSFNPQSRKGIKSLNYKNYPRVSYVELDYITGSFWHNNTYREMWGGFALIKIDPQNTEPLTFMASQEHLFRRAYWSSLHIIKDRFHFLVPLKQALFRKLKIKQRIDIYEKI